MSTTITLWFHRLTCGIAEDIVKIGEKRKVVEKDLDLRLYRDGGYYDLDIEFLVKKFERVYTGTRSIVKAFNSTFGWMYYGLLLLKIIDDAMFLLCPMIISNLISMFEKEPSDRDLTLCMVYAGLYLVCQVATSVSSAAFWVNMNKVWRAFSASLKTCIYDKTLKLSAKSRGEKSSGEILNLMTEADEISSFIYTFHTTISIALSIAVSFYMIYQMVGNAIFIGCISLVLLTAPNYLLSKKLEKLYEKIKDMCDERSKVVTDMLASMKVIKVYVWEHLFTMKLSEMKEEEAKVNKEIAFKDAMQGMNWFCTPFAFVASSLFWYSFIAGNKLNPATVFSLIHLINALNKSFQDIPESIRAYIQAKKSLGRFRDFLDMEEIEPVSRKDLGSLDIQIEKASFSWSDQNTSFLKNISLEVERGKFVAVVGAVGSGKSALLSAILGEMKHTEGSVFLCNGRKLALVEQSPFIRSQTLKQNILFGSSFDPVKYNKVLAAAALEKDLLQLPNGDATLIGEKGINLSGGQKLRVSLARAMYSDADIYILDDPLAAVDMQVGEHIFEHAFNKLLSSKTRILVTNQIQYLDSADEIIVMNRGCIQERGTFQALISAETEFKSLVDVHSKSVSKSLTSPSQSANIDAETNTDESCDESQDEDDDSDNEKEDGNTLSKLQTYYTYLSVYSQKLFLFYLVFSIGKQGFDTIAEYFVTAWGADTDQLYHSHLYYYCNYVLFGLLYLVSLLYSAYLCIDINTRCSNVIHSQVVERVLAAPLSFFDKNPSGKIVKALSKDLHRLDTTVWKIRCIVEVIGQIFFSVVIIGYNCSFAFLIYVSPLIYVTYNLQKRFRCAECDTVVSEIDTRCFNHLSESIDGSVTIRAYSEQENYKRNNVQALKSICTADILGSVLNFWYYLRMSLIKSAFVIIGLIMVIRSNTTPATATLVLTQLIKLSGSVEWFLDLLSYMDADARCINRVRAFAVDTPTENTAGKDCQLSEQSETDRKGKIEFRGAFMKYSENADPALNYTTCEINAGERIGIAGRTGSGKTSLFSSLLRLYELNEGSILLDGMNIRDIPTKDLRRMIATIPQDPVLLSGISLRKNLDLHDEHSDETIWNALEKVCMKDRVMQSENKLESMIAENGRNFSQGERQLLCMCRTLLLMMREKNSVRVLLMDEVSASVDVKTDAIIQETVQRHFNTCTVLTIAHRLDHIVKFSDRVLLLESGKVKAFDTVDKLMASVDNLAEVVDDE